MSAGTQLKSLQSRLSRLDIELASALSERSSLDKKSNDIRKTLASIEKQIKSILESKVENNFSSTPFRVEVVASGGIKVNDAKKIPVYVDGVEVNGLNAKKIEQKRDEEKVLPVYVVVRFLLCK